MKHPGSQQLMEKLYDAEPRPGPVDWCRENVDFSLNPAYPTSYKGRWDPDLLPFWKEPLENMFNPIVREQTLLKPTQAGGTENVCLNGIRFSVAVEPRRILYVWGDLIAAVDDFKERIVGGLECAKPTRDRLKKARSVECRLDFPDMTIVGAWPKNTMAFKRNPWDIIIADEFSTYGSMTPEMIRKRCDTVPFSHICWISSPDPQMKQTSKNDPIFIEFEAGDKREWEMPDPETGSLFRFVMGSRDDIHGLKWDQDAKRDDGTWDEEKVRASAYYVTPDGTRIDNADRMDLVRQGEWIPTRPEAPEWLRSYHINTFYMPFKSGDFGNIAIAFLRANERGPAGLRVFVYEYLAEHYYDTKEEAVEDQISFRQDQYKRGELISQSELYKDIYIEKQRSTVMSVDVQKDTFWYVIRDWIDGGDSGLVDWGHCVTFADLDNAADELKIDFMGIDAPFREMEVMDYAATRNAGGAQWVIPLFSSDILKQSLQIMLRDPYLGKTRAGEETLETYTWNSDVFRSILIQMERGESRCAWRVYRDIEMEYAKQVTAKEKVDGVWRNRRGHSQDHIFACECMQVVLARVLRLYVHRWIEEIVE